jgi:arylsulfatase A
MKTIRTLLTTLLLLAGTAHAGTEQPNIIFFLFDDFGWGQPQCYDSKSKLRTPNFDKLAAEGMRFTDAHSPSAVCTPTRYGVLTGRYPSRIGQFGVLGTTSPPIIPVTRPTVASVLRGRGYATACVGKWHLGMDWMGEAKPGIGSRMRNGPNALGFDYFCGYTHSGNIGMVIEQDQVITQVKDEENQPLMLRKGLEWIGKRDPGKPFFLYFPVCPPHYPVAPSPEAVGKSGAVDEAGKGLKGAHDPAKYPDWVFQGDAMLGGILRALDRLGLAGNTLIIVTGDNGAEHRAYAPLRESKRSIYEGGHRVPFVVRWPGKVKPGTTWNHPLCLTDLMATAAGITGATLPSNAGEDSFSFLPALLGESDGPTREATIHQSRGSDLAIRQGPWKLIFKKDGSRELYNLDADLSETRDVLAANAGVAAKLAALMQRYIDEGRSTPGTAQKNEFGLTLGARAKTKGNKKNKGDTDRKEDPPPMNRTQMLKSAGYTSGIFGMRQFGDGPDEALLKRMEVKSEHEPGNSKRKTRRKKAN